MIKRIWTVVWKPSARWGLGVLLIVGAVGGVVGWNVFHGALEHTNSTEFCISCHTMENTVFQEYKQSPHYKNASGVRAGCPDCHVPKEGLPLYAAKLRASKDVYHEILGTIDTPQKFEDRRLEMAQKVWTRMEESDSRECRSCHSYDSMDFHAQKPKAATAMEKAMGDGETCIACHKGIAHKLPDMSAGYKKTFANLQALAAKEGAKAKTLVNLDTKPLFLDRATASAGGKGDGKLLSGSEVAVAERDGDWLKVTVSGWQQEGAERVIYALKGQRIFTAALDASAVAAVSVAETVVDADTELTWKKVTLQAWLSKDGMLGDSDKLWAYGKEMYGASCGTCHSLRAPDHFLANQWIGTLKAMKRFVSLDNEQYRFLQKYLQLNAKDTGGAGAHG
ncbi:pentaheme c-type cytochrome TorC [Rhodospirillum rubrum]|uniref:pentaheme c-type cytochrome TorC n=1 Tax=Rhodospirillum rubrum TaxID=1085 RepID=UPI00190376B1|nr:pentaheme c-type cytochrome TorC [Rhodospirillum rubrum]MBK1663026.1 pentaheme c-type cytochrome TorC [Rhodospirillum rubrum]MBK1676039.1 pentaheme c-type cytochrome TorC [Rhodospirillum rubrum]